MIYADNEVEISVDDENWIDFAVVKYGKLRVTIVTSDGESRLKKSEILLPTEKGIELVKELVKVYKYRGMIL